jgi:hypothetical protein
MIIFSNFTSHVTAMTLHDFGLKFKINNDFRYRRIVVLAVPFT